jgi:translation elongation factor EF-Tu-like GTPase
MAAKKKSKKSKKSKKAKSRVKAKKPVVKKTKTKAKAKKKVVKKKAPKKKTAARKPAKSRARAAKPAAAKPVAAAVAVPAGAERIGVVTHYFNHLSVAIVQLESGVVRTGDTVHIKGHTSDFRQTVGSMEVDHVHVDEARAGQSFGLRVNEHAREHDVVYKVIQP